MDTLRNITIGPMRLTFHRTCRVPETTARGVANSLPMSVGQFPLFKAGDLGAKRPEAFHPESYFLPIWSKEAMWIRFDAQNPVAMTVGAGMVNAITGKRMEAVLRNGFENPQSYVVCPPQPWLDGFKTADGTVRQFVAVPLGSGQTVEAQVTGEETTGGIQFGIHLPKVDLATVSKPREHRLYAGPTLGATLSHEVPARASATRGMALESFRLNKSAEPTRMGLGAGGQIEQRIYPDPYVQYSRKGPDEIWADQANFKAMAHMVHVSCWEALTGQKPPASPITFEMYQKAKLPWFKLYDDNLGDVQTSEVLANVKPVDVSQEQQAGIAPDPKTSKVW